jgi:hypothetical protein
MPTLKYKEDRREDESAKLSLKEDGQEGGKICQL